MPAYQIASEMKILTLLFTLIFCSLFGLTQELNQIVNDENTDEQILIGDCDRSGLKDGEFGTYYDEYYKSYDPDKDVLKKIKERREGVTITIILGTWCHDSKEQVPRFYKILDRLWWKKKDIRQYCVDTSKLAGDMDIREFDIVKVPTFIFYRDGREIGRIIETPVISLEKDMLMILE
jgi:hypothetical protein